MGGVGEAGREAAREGTLPAEEAEHKPTRGRGQDREADPMGFRAVVIAAVHESEGEIDIGQERGPDRDPDPPRVAKLLAVSRGENVHGEPRYAVSKGRRHGIEVTSGRQV